MDKHGQFFPDDPQSVEELIDSLARRAAAQERMMAGLSPEQRAELSDLMAQTMSDMGLASEMAHLQDALRQARPDLPWGQRGQVPDGEQALGMGDATSAVAELADLEALSSQLSQGYAGASLADIDEELLERALGRPGGRRPRRAAPAGARARAAGLPQPLRRPARALPEGGPPARAPRRCAGCSPSSTPPAAATTT